MLRIDKNIEHIRVELFQVSVLGAPYTDLIRERLLELVRQPGKTVIFNLEGISDMEPGGFEALLEVEREASVRGSTFKLCNVTDELRELILLMELEGNFCFCAGENGEEKVLLELG